MGKYKMNHELDTIIEDEAAFKIISDGMTKGVFQLESYLARKWCRKIKPRDIDEVSDVLAIIRPGALQQADDYIRVKDKVAKTEYLDPRLAPILDSTNGIILYQEQTLKIAQELAGFTESEADLLRQAIGKKLADKMKELEPKFIDGCVKGGMSKENAETLMSIIRESSNYSFNRAHSLAYAANSIMCAYYKANYPIHFFFANLRTSRYKQDPLKEIREIYYDMKDFSLTLVPPRVDKMNEDFEIIDSNTICFGLGHVKGIGLKGIRRFNQMSNLGSWSSILKDIFQLPVSKARVNPLIMAGAFDYLFISRSRMLAECDLIRHLTKKQCSIFFELFDPEIHDKSEKYVAEIIENIPNVNKRLKLSKDTLEAIEQFKNTDYKDFQITLDIWERTYLGVNITASRIDDYNIGGDITHTCLSAGKAKSGNICIVALLENVNKIRTRKDNKEMCFLELSDMHGKLTNVVVFPDCFIETYYNKNLLHRVGEEVLKIHGYRKGDSLICNSIDALQ